MIGSVLRQSEKGDRSFNCEERRALIAAKSDRLSIKLDTAHVLSTAAVNQAREHEKGPFHDGAKTAMVHGVDDSFMEHCPRA